MKSSIAACLAAVVAISPFGIDAFTPSASFTPRAPSRTALSAKYNTMDEILDKLDGRNPFCMGEIATQLTSLVITSQETRKLKEFLLPLIKSNCNKLNTLVRQRPRMVVDNEREAYFHAEASSAFFGFIDDLEVFADEDLSLIHI